MRQLRYFPLECDSTESISFPVPAHYNFPDRKAGGLLFASGRENVSFAVFETPSALFQLPPSSKLHCDKTAANETVWPK
jgi:hypothetical protein